MTTLVGIFVGGAARRMGGQPKGLLATRDGTETLIGRLVRLARTSFATPRLVLVGRAEAYGALEIPALADDPGGVGPIGGLRALLLEAERSGSASAVALSCDLPDVSAELLERLGRHAPESAAVAPRIEGIWQPLFARYSLPKALRALDESLAGGDRSLQGVLARLGSELSELPLADGEAELLRDWDEPADLVR